MDIMEEILLNAHNKAEYEPAHTAEHILNATMVKMFGCPRSRNAHVERKKSKCDYSLEAEPSAEQVAMVEAKVNEVVAAGLDVTVDFVSREEAAAIVDLSKLPEDYRVYCCGGENYLYLWSNNKNITIDCERCL